MMSLTTYIAVLLFSMNARAATAATSGLAGKRALMIVTSHSRLGDTGRNTGLWIEELAVPYQLFKDHGMEVEIAAPKGGMAPIDPESLKNPPAAVAAFLADPEAQAKLSQTKPLHEVLEKYDAYFVVGGHGVMWDLVDAPHLQSLLSRAYDNSKIVAAVCHGPAALVNVRLGNGEPLVRGKSVTGFSNAEEEAAGLQAVVPFALETRIKSLGGLYESAALWNPHAVRDDRLVTGQNPMSSEMTALRTIEALREGSAGNALKLIPFSKERNSTALTPGTAYSVLNKVTDWSKGHTTVFAGRKNSSNGSAKFLADLKSHVGKTFAAFAQQGLLGYLVYAAADMEFAVMHWESEARMKAAFQSEAGKAVAMDAARIFEPQPMVWEKMENFAGILTTDLVDGYLKRLKKQASTTP